MHVAFLQIEPTTRCNYSCGFCAGRHLPQGDLAAQHVERLLDGIEGLAVTVLRDTATDAIDTVLPFYRRLGLDGGVTIQPLQRMPQYVRFYSRSMVEQLPGPEQAQRLNQGIAASPDMAAALRERGAHPGFYERLYGSAAGRPVCPWLENGLFLGHDGALTACCFIKDSEHFALARAGDPLAHADRRRRMMAEELRQGRIPQPCQGCPTANGVAAAAAVRS